MENFEKSIRPYRKGAIILMMLGFAILLLFIILLWFSGMLFGHKINPEFTAMTGTFIGGTIGAIWTLTGVLLYYAALMYQKEELKLSRESRDDLKKAYKEQKDAYIDQLRIYSFNKFQAFALSMIESFRDIRSKLREYETSTSMLIETVPNYIKILKILNGSTADNIIDISEYKELSHRHLLYPIYTEFCETFYILVHKANKNWKETGDEEYLSYESLIIRSLTDEELLIIFYYSLLPKQSLFLREYLKTGKEWAYRMSTQIRIERPNFYSAWDALRKEG